MSVTSVIVKNLGTCTALLQHQPPEPSIPWQIHSVVMPGQETTTLAFPLGTSVRLANAACPGEVTGVVTVGKAEAASPMHVELGGELQCGCSGCSSCTPVLWKWLFFIALAVLLFGAAARWWEGRRN